MVEAMKRVARSNVELTVEERNLLSVAYKNVIGARRASWRIISSIEQKEEKKQGDGKHLQSIRNYRMKVCSEKCSLFQLSAQVNFVLLHLSKIFMNFYNCEVP